MNLFCSKLRMKRCRAYIHRKNRTSYTKKIIIPKTLKYDKSKCRKIKITKTFALKNTLKDTFFRAKVSHILISKSINRNIIYNIKHYINILSLCGIFKTKINDHNRFITRHSILFNGTPLESVADIKFKMQKHPERKWNSTLDCCFSP